MGTIFADDPCAPTGATTLWRLRLADTVASTVGKSPDLAIPRAALASSTRAAASCKSRFARIAWWTSLSNSGSLNDFHHSSAGSPVLVPVVDSTVHWGDTVVTGRLKLGPTAQPVRNTNVAANTADTSLIIVGPATAP